MGACVAKTSHSCGTRQGVQVYERDDGTVDGFCWSCREYVRHPYDQERKIADLPKADRTSLTEAEVAEKLEEIGQYPVVDLKDRRLRADALDHFGIKIGLSEQDGKTPAFHYYPYYADGELVSYKVRMITPAGEPKRMWTVGPHSKVDLFGWPEAIAT